MTDNENTLHLTVTWRKPWLYLFNRYEVGTIRAKSGAHADIDIKKIHRKDDGQLRLKTRADGWPLDRAKLSVNRASVVMVKKAGRRGRLHVWYP